MAQHLTLSIHEIGAPILVVQRDGTISYANPAFGREFGHDPGFLTGRPLSVILPGWARARHPALMESWFQDGRPLRAMGERRSHVQVRDDQNRNRPVTVTLAPGDDDTAVAVVVPRHPPGMRLDVRGIAIISAFLVGAVIMLGAEFVPSMGDLRGLIGLPLIGAAAFEMRRVMQEPGELR